MGRWLDDSLEILDKVATSTTTARKDRTNGNSSSSSGGNNKQILIGSSMGTWLAVLTATQRPDRVAGIIGIASAPDYTALLRRQIGCHKAWVRELDEKGYVDLPTVYDRRGYYRIHRELIDEGDAHLLLDETNNVALPNGMPVRLIHGLDDEDISSQYSRRLAKRLSSSGNPNVRLELIEKGDHRLSSPEHLQKIHEVLDEVVKDVCNSS